jgi:hypothetical protein
MHTALRIAESLRSDYRIQGIASEDEIERVLTDQGLVCQLSRRLRGRLKGYLYHTTVRVRASLARPERAFVEAHELAHHVLGHGNALYLAVPSRRLMLNKEEVQATLFAGALMMGTPRMGPHFDGRLHDAYDAGIPLDCLFNYATALLRVHDGALMLPLERGGLVAQDRADIIAVPDEGLGEFRSVQDYAAG